MSINVTAPMQPVTQADQLLVAQIGDALEDRDFDRADSLVARHRQQAEAASNAQIAELREALDSIDVWLSDTLSGRVQPDPATYKQWLIDAIVEARGRARDDMAAEAADRADYFAEQRRDSLMTERWERGA